MAQKTLNNVIAPTLTRVSKAIQEITYVKSFNKDAVSNVLSEIARRNQELLEVVRPSITLIQESIPSYLNKPQGLLNSIRMENITDNFSKINIPKIDEAMPKFNLDISMSSKSEDIEMNESENKDNE